MGEFEVPESALYGASTARAVENFPISDLKFSRTFIRSLAEIKKACALVNQKNKLLEKDITTAIVESAQEVIDGKHDDDFVLDIFQTGSGTSTNMNANEVIARLASEKSGSEVHPNDHVNMSQSSNDVIPTATNVAAVLEATEGLIPELKGLVSLLEEKGKDWDKVYKNGRTHLMDATPVTLGQEFMGYAALVSERMQDVDNSLDNVRKLAIGGTAVGTGINAPDGFGADVAKEIKKSLSTDFEEVDNHFTRQGSRDEIVQLSGALKSLAVSLFKIANDIRWMGSGPISGLNELKIPALQPGSSIMPGKVNPTQCEALSMVCAQVMGNDVSVTIGGMQGHYELNVYKPLMASNLLESSTLLADAVKSFNDNCLLGIKPNRKRIKELVTNSLMLVTALNSKIGYYKAAEIANQAHKKGTTLKEEAIKLGYATSKEFDKWVDVKKMIGDNN